MNYINMNDVWLTWNKVLKKHGRIIGVSSGVLSLLIIVKLILPMYGQMEAAKLEIAKLKSESNSIEAFKRKNEDYETKIKTLFLKLGELKNTIRDREECSILGEEIQKEAAERNILIKELNFPSKNKAKPVKKDKIVKKGVEAITIQMLFSGEYSNIIAFLDKIEAKHLYLDNFQIKPGKNYSDLSVSCKLVFYVMD